MELEVHIKCPCCSAQNFIKVPAHIFEKNSSNMISINIGYGICCIHSFLAIFDRRGRAKAFEKLDYEANQLYPLDDMKIKISEESNEISVT